jgi:hypothetical protein
VHSASKCLRTFEYSSHVLTYKNRYIRHQIQEYMYSLSQRIQDR